MKQRNYGIRGSGAKSLSAALRIEQDKLSNAFDILSEYRQTIRHIQHQFVKAVYTRRAMTSLLIARTIEYLNNITNHRAEVDALYNSVQYLMAEIYHICCCRMII